MTAEPAARPPFGALLRQWRERRRISQWDLGLEAGVSARHVSFLETGRAQPSRDMVLRLADQLQVPLRERNPLLLAAGYAPSYAARALDDPEMAAVRAALTLILAGYEPHPALAVDRAWHLVAANRLVGVLVAGAAPELLQPPVNVLRLSLHPDGLAGRIANLGQWRAHVLGRLAREAAVTGDQQLHALHRELLAYPGGLERSPTDTAVAVPLRLRVQQHDLALLSTVTTFGTALDITAAELSVEAFLPADARTAAALRALTPTSEPEPIPDRAHDGVAPGRLHGVPDA